VSPVTDTVAKEDDHMGHFSTFLFARPSFLEGAARVIDIGGTLDHYNTSRTPAEADTVAAWADWCAVAEDLLAAMKAERAALSQAQGRGRTPVVGKEKEAVRR
jgi:hypothetical protein